MGSLVGKPSLPEGKVSTALKLREGIFDKTILDINEVQKKGPQSIIEGKKAGKGKQ